MSFSFGPGLVQQRGPGRNSQRIKNQTCPWQGGGVPGGGQLHQGHGNWFSSMNPGQPVKWQKTGMNTRLPQGKLVSTFDIYKTSRYKGGPGIYRQPARAIGVTQPPQEGSQKPGLGNGGSGHTPPDKDKDEDGKEPIPKLPKREIKTEPPDFPVAPQDNQDEASGSQDIGYAPNHLNTQDLWSLLPEYYDSGDSHACDFKDTDKPAHHHHVPNDNQFYDIDPYDRNVVGQGPSQPKTHSDFSVVENKNPSTESKIEWQPSIENPKGKAPLTMVKGGEVVNENYSEPSVFNDQPGLFETLKNGFESVFETLFPPPPSPIKDEDFNDKYINYEGEFRKSSIYMNKQNDPTLQILADIYQKGEIPLEQRKVRNAFNEINEINEKAYLAWLDFQEGNMTKEAVITFFQNMNEEKLEKIHSVLKIYQSKIPRETLKTMIGSLASVGELSKSIKKVNNNTPVNRLKIQNIKLTRKELSPKVRRYHAEHGSAERKRLEAIGQAQDEMFAKEEGVRNVTTRRNTQFNQVPFTEAMGEADSVTPPKRIRKPRKPKK